MNLSRRRLLILGSALPLAGTAAATPLQDLYQARTIVTGQRPETRSPGMVRCLAQVLVRASGDPRLARHAALAGLSASPEAAVKSYAYRDLSAFPPITDQQGTRDRPYEMTVRYEAAKIDAMLAQMGATPWRAERPRLVVFLAVRHIGSAFMLSSMADQGELLRQSFQDAAWNAAIEVVIPSPRTIARAGLTVDGTPGTSPRALMPFVDQKLGQLPLVGTLDWSMDQLAWRASWRLWSAGREERWAIAGVNFDAAFRNGVGGAAMVLSGTAAPG